MKNSAFVVFALFAIGSDIVRAQNEAPSPSQTAVSVASESSSAQDVPVRQLLDGYTKAVNERNMDGIIEFFTDDTTTITLKLGKDGAFTWTVSQEGRTQTIQGEASYEEEVLILGQPNGPPLSGKVQLDKSNNVFTLTPPGAPANVEGLRFARQSP
ncbi:MAG: hypothetical protein JW829_01825 [Pirellulales bacterium]|nr:hypothetical protein [Pirellulales bacterium]